jgi:hypothetical protein
MVITFYSYQFLKSIIEQETSSHDGWCELQITAYFVALATLRSSQVVSVVDKFGGTEKLIQQSDMGGSPAVKLDLSLDTPIIIMPRCSDS